MGSLAAMYSFVYNTGKLSVQLCEHVYAVLFVKRKQDLTVGIALKGILWFQLFFQLLKAINFTVAHHVAAIQMKRLHSERCQSHDRQSMKSQKAIPCIDDPAVIWASRFCTGETFFKHGQVKIRAAISHNRTHREYLHLLKG